MESLTNWCVYMHTNRVNGKKYIGITSQKPTKRWENGNHYNTQPHFWRAIQKYGWDGFTHEILFTELTEKEAKDLESYLIAKYKTQNPDIGYNVSSGGDGNHGWKHTDEAKEKIGAASRGRVLSKDHKEKIKASNLAKWSSKETLDKVSGKNNWNAHSVLCVETGKIYETMSEASNKIGAKIANISKVCLGKRKTAGGFHWKYSEAVEKNA